MTAPAPSAEKPCERCGCRLERGDLRCPVCSLAVPAGSVPNGRAQVTLLRCSSCRAAITWSAEAKAPKCAWCGSVMALEQTEDPVEQAEAVVPFAVDPAGARRALQEFLGRERWFRPSDLKREATLDSLRAVWWPAWIVNAEALASWTADSNAGAGRAAWAPHSGQERLRICNLAASASRGLSAQEREGLAPGYDLGGQGERETGPEQSPRALASRPQLAPEGAVSEPFELKRSQARQLVGQAIEAHAQRVISAGHVPGSSVRKLSVAVLLTGLETRRIALPAYVLAYRYRGTLYRVVINGQTPTYIVGKVPLSPWKILGAAVAAVAFAGAVLAILSLL